MKRLMQNKFLCFFMWLMLVSSLVGPIHHAYAGETEFRVPEGQRQLFLDDHGIAKLENLKRTMHRPQKHGAVVRSPNPAQTIQTRTAPVWDPMSKLFKFWVLGIDSLFWQSKDGIHWTPGPKPNMRIDMAVYDPNPSRRFKAPLLNTGFAASPDGVTWTKLDVTKIQSSDEGNFSYDPQHELFIHTVKRGGPHGRAVAIATSHDFKTWKEFGVVFHTDKLDQELGVKNIKARRADEMLQQTAHDDPKTHNVDVYNMGVFHYEGLYIGMPALYHATGPVPNYPNTVGFHLIQLVCSRNLQTWLRLGDRRTFIGPSRLDSGAYDLTQILPPSAPVVREDELWFYYTGLKYRGTFNYVGKYPNGKYVPNRVRGRDLGAVCLAVLRRDGFISLDANKKEGQLSTQAFTVSAGKLFVNIDAHGGEMTVEVLDEHGKVVATSTPMTADHRRTEVTWDQGNIADLKGKVVSLRFTFRNASLYSYWVDD